MRCTRIILFALLFGLLTGSLRPTGAAPAGRLAQELAILPGVRIGPVRIGDARRYVHSILGMPDQIDRDASPICDTCQNVYWVYDLASDSKYVLVVSWTLDATGERGGVDFIYTNSPQAYTVQHIRIGTSTAADVYRAYGVPDDIRPAGYNSVALRYRSGIRVRVSGERNIVEAITITAPH